MRSAVAAMVRRARLAAEGTARRPADRQGGVGRESIPCRVLGRTLAAGEALRPLLAVGRNGRAARPTPAAPVAGVAASLVLDAGFDLLAHRRGELDRAELVRRAAASLVVALASAALLDALAWVTLTPSPGREVPVMIAGGLLVAAVFRAGAARRADACW